MLSPEAFVFDTKCTSFRVETDNIARAALQAPQETIIATGCVIDNEVSSKRVNELHNSQAIFRHSSQYLLFWTVQ